MPGQKDCPDRQELREFTLGRIADLEADQLEQHLSGCRRCLQTIETLGDDDMLTQLLRSPATVAERPGNEKTVLDLIQRLKGLRSQAAKTAGVADDTPFPGQAGAGAATYDFLAPAQKPGEIGRLGHYRVLRVLGSGGMSVVFEAEDPELRRTVALKALKPALAASASGRQRFLHEARAAAAVTHDHLVPIYQVGEDRGVPFLAMQLLRGETLEDRLRREGPLCPTEIVRIGAELADGLAAAHARGLVHRDIKPANIWLEAESGRVKILDFGLARAAEADGRITDPGTVVGTPAYMAPEQARGEAVDGRCDLFSLGSVLYTLCTGRPPFAGAHGLAILRAVCDDSPPPIQNLNPEAPAWLITLIERLHTKDPAGRLGSAAEVARLLRRQQAPGQQASRFLAHGRLGLAAAAILLALVAGLGLTEATGVTHLRQFLTVAGPLIPSHPDRPGPGENAQPQIALAGTKGIDHQEKQDAAADESADGKADKVYPLAIFSFEERGAGARDMGSKVSDLLFARLAARPELYLVDRQELNKTLAEQELNLSGAVKPSEATRIGQLTGAKLLLTGSVIHVDKKLYLVAKVIATETTRMVGVTVEGKASDDLGSLVEKLANEVAGKIQKQAGQLVARPIRTKDRVVALNEKLGQAPRPAVLVSISERHVGQAVIDPAAQTELAFFCKETGFPVIDPEEGSRSKADVLLTGQGFSELATRHGNLISVKARVEVKAVNRKTGELLAADRQTEVVVDLTEQIAGKEALQHAAAAIAERLLPRLVKK
jgi:TolB-like protein